MQNIEIEIRKIYFKHFKAVGGDTITPFAEELATLLMSIITKAKDEGYKEGAFISIRELEEILVMVRDFKTFYENATPPTSQDVLRLDELKQLEYKLTEKIITNR